MKKSRRALFIILGAPFVLGAAAAGTALAWNTSTNTSSNCDNATVQPYTGGAPAAKVFYPSDGSTVTITNTGAVIKQSPCGTAYREGWVNPCDVSGINVYSNIPKLQSGTSNPYSSSCGHQTTPSSTASGQSQSSSSAKASATANATSNATVNVTSTSPPAVAAANTTRSTTSHQTGSGTSSTTTSSAANTAATLPNTGPGNVLALGALTAAIGAIGHFLYKTRFRLLG